MQTKKGFRVKKTTLLIYSAIFTALIFLCTAYILHIPIGMSGGYVHMGDALLYLAACVLPTPYAMLACAVGAGLADFASGFPMWIPFTMVIKPCMVLFFTGKQNAILSKTRNRIAPFFAGLFCVAAYGAATWLLYGTSKAALADIPAGLIKCAANMAVFYPLAAFLDKTNLFRRHL